MSALAEKNCSKCGDYFYGDTASRLCYGCSRGEDQLAILNSEDDDHAPGPDATVVPVEPPTLESVTEKADPEMAAWDIAVAAQKEAQNPEVTKLIDDAAKAPVTEAQEVNVAKQNRVTALVTGVLAGTISLDDLAHRIVVVQEVTLDEISQRITTPDFLAQITQKVSDLQARRNPAPVITTQATAWYERESDKIFNLDEAINYTKDLADHSGNRVMELDDFELAFDNGNVEVRNRRSSVGSSFRWTLNHWSFGQLCTLVGAPASFLRTIPGSLAVECLNVKLRQRNKGVKVYRTIADVRGLKSGTVRAFTSKRYKRYTDAKLLQWVKDSGLDTDSVATSDRGVEALTLGQHSVLTPDRTRVRMCFLVGNSEVGAASLSTNAVLKYQDFWRIPITLAGARVRHTGDVDQKAMDKLEAAKKAFEGADLQDLQSRIDACGLQETRTQAQWFTFLKSCRVGKTQAKSLLPKPDQNGDITTSRWKLALDIARKAAHIPYFDDRLQEEMKAAKVLGL